MSDKQIQIFTPEFIKIHCRNKDQILRNMLSLRVGNPIEFQVPGSAAGQRMRRKILL